MGTANPNGNNFNNLASAQEPKRKPEKLTLGRELHIATLSTTGTNKIGKIEKVNQWMKNKQIDIPSLQETNSAQTKGETRKDYTWCFSGNGENRCNHGVGIVIHNKIAKHIEDVRPMNDNLRYVIIDGTIPINIIVTYHPTSAGTTDK